MRVLLVCLALLGDILHGSDDPFWEPSLVIVDGFGKDNLVFHTLFWPGELHVHDEKLHLPDVPVINQFLTLEGEKFSKSRGVTVASG